jgi:glycosyltransferase involved in cell wall biosynthesis
MISVAMATLDGMRFLPEQFGSILSQLERNDELVVSDNGSTDGTLAFLKEQSARDSRVRVIHFLERRGVVPNFENALLQIHGDVVLLCDQDDIWLPGRVEFFRVWFSEHPQALLLQTDAELFDEQGRTTEPSYFLLRRSGPGLLKNIWKNTYQGCSLGFRKALLDVALPLPTRLPMHDMWLGLLAEFVGRNRSAFFPRVLTRYRRHGGNASTLVPAPWKRIVVWRCRLAGSLLGRLPNVMRFRHRLVEEGSR